MSRRVADGLRIIVLCGVVLLTAACSSFEYVIRVANYGTHGVILRKFHVVQFADEAGDTWGVYPELPVSDDFKRFEHFVGYPHSLPKTLVVTWQLAELSDCVYVYRNPNYKGHVIKLNCTWAPIEDKIFHQRIDMAAIRASEAYQRVGESSPVSSPYSLIIQFIFNEDSMTVKTTNDYRLFN